MAWHHNTFDTVIIGAGQAGPSLASALDGRSERVALFQDGPFGGTCLNDGCRPTKALRASAAVAQLARTGSLHGVKTDVEVDLATAVARKDALISKWRDASAAYYEDHPRISYVTARARIVGRSDNGFRIAASGREVTAERVILNTGARSVPPDLPGLNAVEWLDHHSILDLTDLPSHLIILGGSYIGLEFAQIFSRFGSRVTILQRGPRIIGGEDPDISEAIATMLREEGIQIRTSTGVSRVDPSDSGITVTLSGGETLSGTHLLIATGRVPNSDDLGLESIQVATDQHGYITTDEHFLTSVPGVYAVGDVNGRGAFTHTSYQDGEILADHLGGGSRSVANRIPTYALFTDPPLGRVGLTETEARSKGLAVAVSSVPGTNVTRAALESQTAGLWKLVVNTDTDRVVGASCFGISGDEVVQALSLLMHVDAPASALATWLPIHPTVSEFLPTFYASLS